MTNLFGHSVRSEMLLLYLVEGLVCFSAVYLLLAMGAAQSTLVEGGGGAAFAAVLALSSGPVSGAAGLYQLEAWSQIRRIVAGVIFAGLLLLALALLTLKVLGPVFPEGLVWQGLLEVLLATTAAVVLTRIGFVSASRAGLFTRRVAVVRGASGPSQTEAVVQDDRAPGSFEIALTAEGSENLDAELALDRLRSHHVWAVIAADPATIPEDIRQRCNGAGVRVFGDTEFCERHLGRVNLDCLPVEGIAASGRAHEGRVEAALRRGFDATVSLLLLLLTLPLLLLTALAIKIDSPGPIFYRQERVGRDGRVFMLLKFRSMRMDAEAGGTPRWATRHDQRVTQVGRFIRLTRIDEIPQVLNVLRGDMAFVGPRPERPIFVEQLERLIPHYRDRACVKPGITGWAQINFPYGASVEDARQKLAYDLYYIRRRSLFLDLLILIATVRVVLFQEGSR
ncbi:exopolysaccharide biosynthesis polyprenyl glycosylphosphotransferase [Roseomonas xinghualingensis]|uniref:exopolysaccharide biosynthesis polyprenyl glycosylphosphotransferase n=1 Tax=Roseomonas xinghualingensis TaxID=2986475 RepID=UPI0021F2499D|nr:exopolysaccharide biosynthesis polyprenyl glycosylphosphotransferase [Roseomonas sp. SXEYE001]MCV4208315.1 exopolysaccharide biosynthesis polyprenyl glycosylphosphotransferase [Roseomonas sp. SXEYE001]